MLINAIVFFSKADELGHIYKIEGLSVKQILLTFYKLFAGTQGNNFTYTFLEMVTEMCTIR